ncbi:Histone acetyl transferase-like protein [Elsinoe fawcettii]|nr:Histone acetyl transferase-like protein [Elsinoe fawcettii]
MASDGDDVSDIDQAIAEQVGEWSTNSNEAFTIHIYQGDKKVESFNPEFTYPIYGEEEAIFGYQGLNISLSFASHNLRPHLEVKYGKKFPQQGEIQATDVREPLEDFLPPAAFRDVDRKTALADSDAPNFVPPGKKLETIEVNGKIYEVWVAPFSDPRVKELILNMQILVPMFIEGGTIMELEYPWIVDRWKLFLLYEVDPSPPPSASKYVIAGYVTSFQAFTLPARGDELESTLQPHPEAEFDNIVSTWSDFTSSSKPSPLSLPSRERISQVILLPSRQRSGLGSRLYSIIYQYLTKSDNITELTVEDPNAAFDDMRDIADMAYLRSSNPTFKSLRLPTSIPSSALAPDEVLPLDLLVPSETRTKLAKETKIQSRQLSRLVEMQLLSTIPRPNRNNSRITRKEKSSNDADRQYYFWRLLAKERLYQFNRDSLAQLDLEERVEKVDAATDGLKEDYERLLEGVEKRERAVGGANGTNGNAGSTKKRRKRVQIQEEEGDDGEAVEEKEEGSSRKKKRKAIVEDDEEDS